MRLRVSLCVCVWGGGGGVGAIKQGGGAIKRGGGGASAPNAPPMGTPLCLYGNLSFLSLSLDTVGKKVN